LLDQDRAVRSANLAGIYRDAGMFDVSVREASRAVSYDYANYSAHLFLASSYDALRDPNRINLRYETPAESEYLIANLLAPVGAGMLAQSLSQQQYSRLSERDGFGIVSSTEYLSRGAWVEKGAQYGTFGNSAYAFEALYRTDPGQRPNNDFEETELHLHLRQQLTPQDSLYFRAIYYEAQGGDVNQYFDPSTANLQLRTRESQEPLLSLGYRHEWAPGVHTLMLASRLSDDYFVLDPAQSTFFIIKPDGGDTVFAQEFKAREKYHSSLEIYSVELQQIWQQLNHNTIIGARYQAGDFRTRNLQTDPSDLGDSIIFFDPDAPLASQDLRSHFHRFTFYGYQYWQIVPVLQLVGGLAYDWLKFPENFRFAPVSRQERDIEGFSPKAGFIWNPFRATTFRFAYTRSIAGASVDQTFLLEPSQVAGLNQSFRSIIPESVAGAETGARFETFAFGLDQKFNSGTYLGLSGQILNSDVQRRLGTFEYTGISFFAQPSSTPDPLDYTEKSLLLAFNQLLGDGWSFGASYRLTQADLNQQFTDIPSAAATIGFAPKEDRSALLHQVILETIYNHPSGFFTDLQALWYRQNNHSSVVPLSDEDFWQFNLFAGYRFPGRKAELRIGLLNLADQDYRLNPVTLYNELPRKRTFAARFQFNF